MRTFAFACAIAVVMARRTKKDEPKVEPEPKKEEEIPEPIIEPEPVEPAQKRDFYEKIATFDFYAKAIWQGCYQGLYGMGRLE